MQITNVMKYHYAKAVVFSLFNKQLLTADEYQAVLLKLAKMYDVPFDESNNEKR